MQTEKSTTRQSEYSYLPFEYEYNYFNPPTNYNPAVRVQLPYPTTNHNNLPPEINSDIDLMDVSPSSYFDGQMFDKFLSELIQTLLDKGDTQ